jgi:hypothetical protein
MAERVKEYTLVDGDGETELIQNVNRLIKQGWSPIGVPMVALDPQGNRILFQAMILFISPKKTTAASPERAKTLVNGAGPANHTRPAKPGKRTMSAGARKKIAEAKRRRSKKAAKKP